MRSEPDAASPLELPSASAALAPTASAPGAPPAPPPAPPVPLTHAKAQALAQARAKAARFREHYVSWWMALVQTAPLQVRRGSSVGGEAPSHSAALRCRCS